jgi:S-adenosylmethionine hydrolase
VRLNLERLAPYGVGTLSATFHGRDLFAPVAAELARGGCTAADLGDPIEWPERSTGGGPRRELAGLRGTVVSIDRFGNLITDIERESLGGLTEPIVVIAGRRITLRRTYGEVPPGELLALINSFDVLEIAQGQGSAAAKLELGRGTPVEIIDGTPNAGSSTAGGTTMS